LEFGVCHQASEDRDLAWLDVSNVQELSNDGKEMLFSELSYGKGRNSAIYLRRTDGRPAVRLGYGHAPKLSHDGKWVLCFHRNASGSELLVLPTGAGEARVLNGEGLQYGSAEWFPDSQKILFVGNQPNQPVRTYIRDLAGGQSKPITPEGVRASRVSPDGKLVVIIDSGRLCLRTVDAGPLRPVAAIEPGESADRHEQLRRPLSHRAQSPGVSQSTYQPRSGPSWKRRHGPAAPAPGWHAELLLSRRGLSW
jgi:eukaryotic-like serine/threonine-protein kinase